MIRLDTLGIGISRPWSLGDCGLETNPSRAGHEQATGKNGLQLIPGTAAAASRELAVELPRFAPVFSPANLLETG